MQFDVKWRRCLWWGEGVEGLCYVFVWDVKVRREQVCYDGWDTFGLSGV